MKSSGNKLLFDPSAIKDALIIDRDILLRIKQAIEFKLVTKPELYGSPLHGVLRPFWRLRVGDYRVVYKFAEGEVRIFAIVHRKDVYKMLERRL
ncbi:MAG: type II toxin-antitoxin system RelE/ParE family toxin [Candidatus Paceibacterota bacterium]|jgi:mRNA interferase RelE/StbE